MTKDEIKQKQKDWYNKNREKVIEKSKKYAQDNKEKRKEYEKIYRQNNKERGRVYKRQYYEKNLDDIKNKGKEYRKQNKEKKKLSDREYAIKNRVKLSEKKKLWALNNKEKVKASKTKHFLKKIHEDPLHKLRCYISSKIRQSLKKNGYTKKSKSFEILGCTYEEFKFHIEKQFEPWMCWDNYGNKNGVATEINMSWDIDHIIPLSSAKNEEDVLKLNHYTNLRPLCSYINRWVKKDLIQ